ncbi:hypothetical protein Tco_0248238 [Tanacetum coccineum]
MSWFSRCSWCGGPFNGGNCRHCTNVSFGDEPVYDSNPNSTPYFSNQLPYHNYETDSRSDTGAAFQAEFAKFQKNFERFMAQLSCSHCGGLFIVLEEGTGRGDGQGKGKGRLNSKEMRFIEIDKKKELQHLEQVANLSTYPSQRFKSFCYDDDDDYDYEESTIPLNEIDSQIPPSIWQYTLFYQLLEPRTLHHRNEELSPYS